MSNTARRKTRLQFFLLHLRKAILQTLFTTFAQHYHHTLRYEYDSYRRTILVREFISTNNNSNDCLCGHYQERTILNQPFLLPNRIPSNVAYQLNSNSHEVSVFETSQYHIIPLPLIERFFREWLTGPTDNAMHANFNGCMNTLYGRLKRSMQKILLARLKKTNQISNDVWYRLGVSFQSQGDDQVYSEIFAHADTWLRGNIFLGPRNRGPFDPRFDTDEETASDAFEMGSSPILGEDRYHDLLDLFYRLYSFTFVVKKPDSLTAPNCL